MFMLLGAHQAFKDLYSYIFINFREVSGFQIIPLPLSLSPSPGTSTVHILADLRTITKYSINEFTMALCKSNVKTALTCCWVMPTIPMSTHEKKSSFLWQDIFFPPKIGPLSNFQILRYFFPMQIIRNSTGIFTVCCLLT